MAGKEINFQPEVNYTMEPIIAQIYADVLQGHQKEVASEIKTALKQKIPANIIMNQGMIAAMHEVGELFEAGEFYVPEMLVAARAMQAGMNVLKPYLAEIDSHPAGKIAIGTVEGDFHDIGKNLVKMMLEGAGFEVIDLGVDVSPGRFVSAVKNDHVDILAISALITTTMDNIPQVLDALEKSGLRRSVKVIIGGAPVTQEFAQKIGADGYAPDASRSATLAKSLITR
jgi:5-methyltetrahydrofolate--homocysteine methyltransferase